MRFFKKFYEQLLSGDLQINAAALSFSTILSIIPFLAVTLAIIQYFNGLESFYPKIEALLLSFFKGPAGNEGIEIIKKIFRRIQNGRAGTIGAVTLVLASMLLMKDIERAFHRVWNISNKRPLYKRIFVYWFLLMLIPFLLAGSVALSSIKQLHTASSLAPSQFWPAFILFFVLFCLYKLVPNLKVKNLPAAIGAAAGTFGLILLFKFFKILTTEVFNYSKVYGSVAALPALLIWILITWYIILLGASVTASFHSGGNGASART